MDASGKKSPFAALFSGRPAAFFPERRSLNSYTTPWDPPNLQFDRFYEVDNNLPLTVDFRPAR